MPATVVNGKFSSSNITWQSAIATGIYAGYCTIANPLNVSVTLTSLNFSGTFAAEYSATGGQTGTVLNPDQSVIVQIIFIPAGAGLRTAQLQAVFTPVSGLGLATVNISVLGTRAGTNLAQPFPDLLFPTTKLASTSTFTNAIIVNTALVNVTVTNIAMLTGTDFFVVGAPIVPFVINASAASPIFSIQFTPTVVGSRNDQLQVTVGGNLAVVNVNGVGSVLQSAFNLTGATQGSLFAFPGIGTPSILLADPNNLNTEEACSFVKLHDFQIPNSEKQLMRIRGHYEDLGAAVVTFLVRSRRQGQTDEIIQIVTAIGTVAADGWIREFTSEPTPVTGELIQINVTKGAGDGPVSLIDYMPEFEPKGQVIGGT